MLDTSKLTRKEAQVLFRGMMCLIDQCDEVIEVYEDLESQGYPTPSGVASTDARETSAGRSPY